MKKHSKTRYIAGFTTIGIGVVLVYFWIWFQVWGIPTYTDTLPDDLSGLSATGATDTDGIIYFDLSHFGTDGRPLTPGNYLMEYDTTTKQFTARRVVSFAMQYQRHDDTTLSYYEIDPITVFGQSQGWSQTGLPTQNGGVFTLVDNQHNVKRTLSDDRGLDLHDLIITPDGHYIYMITDYRTKYDDNTITCIFLCGMFGQSVIEITSDGQELYRYDLLDYYDRDDFIMDDVFTLGEYKYYDLTHANSLDLYQDMLIVSVRHTNEIIALARDTGDLVWRTSQMEFVNDNGFAHQHDAHFTPDGTLLLFDNGNGLHQQSRAVEYQIEGDRLVKIWEYSNGTLQPNRGSARRLSDGSTLINFVTYIELVKDDTVILRIDFPSYYTSYQADFN